MSTPFSLPVHVSLGAYGRTSHLSAIAEMIACPPTEPLLGKLSMAHVQVCPQNHGVFDIEVAGRLRQAFPDIRWRLHANVRVQGEHRWADIGDLPRQRDYFRELAQVSQALAAPAYTAHAGRRQFATLGEVFRHARELEDLFGIPVGIEGHYPTREHYWLIATWEEYRALLESGVPYALDLSHLHILAVRSRRCDVGLVRELLACERCLEVHLSHNNGQADQHEPLTEIPWWWSLLHEVHPQAVLFSEGRQRVRQALEVAA